MIQGKQITLSKPQAKTMWEDTLSTFNFILNISKLMRFSIKVNHDLEYSVQCMHTFNMS